MPFNDTKTPVGKAQLPISRPHFICGNVVSINLLRITLFDYTDLLREYASARNLAYRFSYKTVQLPYRPHARFECQVQIGDQNFEAGSDFASKSDAMHAAARAAIRSLMGETKSPEGEDNAGNRSRCDFESVWGNLTVPWWANTKILVDRLQNLGGFTYSYILNEICKTNKIAIPLNIEYKEIKEGEYIAQLVFLGRLFLTQHQHLSERDAKQDLSRIIVWTLLGKMDHRTSSRPAPINHAMVTQSIQPMSTQAMSTQSIPTEPISIHSHMQRDPISWADVVVRRTSVSSSVAAHPGSVTSRSDSYDMSSVTTSPRTTATTATSITAGDLSCSYKENEFSQLTRQPSSIYPFPHSARMPAALQVDNIHIDWPVSSVLGCLDLDEPTQAELDEISTPRPSMLSELNTGSTVLSPAMNYKSPQLPSFERQPMAVTQKNIGWYQRDVSSRSRLLLSSYTPSTTQAAYRTKDSSRTTAPHFTNNRQSQAVAGQLKSTSSYYRSPWQEAGSQAMIGLSDQVIKKAATTKLSQFMQLVYPTQSVIHYSQVYSTEGIKASVSCGPLGKFVSRMAVGAQRNGVTYNFSEVIEDAASVALETVSSQYF
ncbi:hypothetical protein NQZ79_g3590 [Umbelopsis isabellina]|nr:hypothetical protein NQZ79_g3590 [Umbelopsis isabellina]